MIKHSIIIIYILFLAGQDPLISGQQEYSSRNDVADRTKGSNIAISGEHIFIHTDREEYIAGENCWFAAYLTDSRNNSRPGMSQIAYIELLNISDRPVVQKRISINEGSGHGCFVIPDTLSSGSYILRAYTNFMKNFPPEKCFMKVINIYNSFNHNGFRKKIFVAGDPEPDQNSQTIDETGISDVPVQIISVQSPDSYKRRERITIDIRIDKTAFSSPEKANLSIVVAAVTPDREVKSIRDHLLMKPEPGESTEVRYKPEVSGHILSGKLISQNPGAELKDQIILLSVLGKEVSFQYAITDREGNFSFIIGRDEAQKNMVIQQKQNEYKNLISIRSSFWEKYPDHDLFKDTLYADIPEYIKEWSDNCQVSKIYGISFAGEPLSLTPQQKKSPRFYGIPDMELIMADYILLPAMQEVFFELIPGVSIRTGRNNYGITVTNPRDNETYQAEATLMIDGFIIDDPSLIVEMNTEMVERIDIVRTEHIVGGYHFMGIVNVITKSGNFDDFPLPENAVRFSYRVCDPDIPFVSPDYSDPERKQSRIPDFRNTLYWNPSLKPDKEGNAKVEFWASDYKSDIEINIQGISCDGKVISFKKIIEVE